MQTFLPHRDFRKSAKVLDMKRLGKQRVETLQILKTLALGDAAKGWKNHPAVKMWKGHENALVEYGVTMCAEWKERGYNDTCTEKILAYKNQSLKVTYPKWVDNGDVHASHRSNLLRKHKDYYSQFDWQESDELPYVWPASQNDVL